MHCQPLCASLDSDMLESHGLAIIVQCSLLCRGVLRVSGLRIISFGWFNIERYEVGVRLVLWLVNPDLAMRGLDAVPLMKWLDSRL